MGKASGNDGKSVYILVTPHDLGCHICKFCLVSRCALMFDVMFQSIMHMCIIECFRGRHRGGRHFISFLQYSGPFSHSTKWAFSTLKLAPPWKETPKGICLCLCVPPLPSVSWRCALVSFKLFERDCLRVVCWHLQIRSDPVLAILDCSIYIYILTIELFLMCLAFLASFPRSLPQTWWRCLFNGLVRAGILVI